MFTKMASSGTTAMVNLGAPAPGPDLGLGGAEVTWVPENTVPVSSGSTVGDVGDREAVLKGPETTTGFSLTGGSGQPAVTLPTALSGETLVRVSAEQGVLVVEYGDTATGATSKRTVAMPQVTVRPRYAPQGTASRTAWVAPKLSAVALEPTGAAWAVSAHGDDGPSGWGAVLRLPAR